MTIKLFMQVTAIEKSWVHAPVTAPPRAGAGNTLARVVVCQEMRLGAFVCQLKTTPHWDHQEEDRQPFNYPLTRDNFFANVLFKVISTSRLFCKCCFSKWLFFKMIVFIISSFYNASFLTIHIKTLYRVNLALYYLYNQKYLLYLPLYYLFNQTYLL